MKKNILLILCLFISILIYSKEVSVKVIDKDLKIPLEGVKITERKTDRLYFSDSKGKVVISVDDESDSVIINAELIGYEAKKAYIKELDKEFVVEMSIEGFLEGKELVIEEKAIGKTDEKVGESLVVDKQELNATAEIGPIEDAMNSLKFLPGVSFAGGFDSRLYVRGGNWDELTVVYDGFIIRFPYHWGGAYSVLNPHVLESLKFSTGIFPVKYGYAISGLIDANGVKPDEGFKINTGVSSLAFDTYLQTPVGLKNSGLFLGGRVTYQDLIYSVNDALKDNGSIQEDGIRFSTPPNIRDAYLSWYWNPHKRVEWYINGLFASDSIGVSYDQEKSSISDSSINTKMDFNWNNYDAVGFTRLKFLPTDNIFIYYMAGYEFLYENFSAETSENGKMSYSDEFKEYYKEQFGVYPASNSVEIKDHDSKFFSNQIMHSIQSRLDFDFKLSDNILLQTGIGGIFDILLFEADGEFYNISYDNGVPTYKKQKYEIYDEYEKYKRFLKSFIYLSFQFDVIAEILEIELGCRVDHTVIYAHKLTEDGALNTYPIPGPRFNIRYTPIRNLKYLESLTLSCGIGLFTKTPSDEVSVNGKFDLNDFDVLLPKALSNVFGIEFVFPDVFKLKVEGYYKYYFHRFYANYDRTKTDIADSYIIHSDGIGHVAGFDVLIQRKLSRYFDGFIQYTFTYARYFNPVTDNLDEKRTATGEPTGQWYYPSYHRFHIISFVFDIKPARWISIIPTFKFATGIPIKKYGKPEVFGAQLEDGTVVEMWSREQFYDDNLRSTLSMVLDLKLSFHFYFPKRKLQLEAYIGVQDLLTLFYKTEGGTTIDQYSGEERTAPESNTSMQMPIPSVGLRITY